MCECVCVEEKLEASHLVVAVVAVVAVAVVGDVSSAHLTVLELIFTSADSSAVYKDAQR